MNDDGILGHKQHLNLSFSAYDILLNDMYAFHYQTPSSLLNGIFQSYYELADASVGRALKRKKQQLMEALSGVKDNVAKEEILETLLRQEKERLLAKIHSYPKGYGFKFYLNTENADLLMDEFQQEAEWYNDRPMRYFKAVIEEYAEKSAFEREGIFYRETLEELQRCIDSGTLVCIETSGCKYEVKPYQLLADHESLYHYLVGISAPVGADPKEGKIASFRISRITKLKSRPKSYRSGRITLREKEQIQKKLQEEGVNFLIGQQEKILVRLTEQGEKWFKSQLHLRPRAIKVEQQGDTFLYHFNCTLYQAKSYFFKFGAEAEILAPQALREAFQSDYRRALHRYEPEAAAEDSANKPE